MRKIIILLSILFIFTKIGFPHKINNFAYREGNQITGEAYFADGSPCIKCKVEVYDEKGTKILETITDEKGKYNFVINEKGSLSIKVIAGEGHLAEYKLEKLKEEKKEKKEPTKPEVFKISQTEKMIQNLKLTDEEIKLTIKEIVNDAIKEAIKPETEGIKSLLMEMKKDMDKVRLHDIIGGIGYIFGIWGIIAILSFRKKR